jgi:hypothetical protein
VEQTDTSKFENATTTLTAEQVAELKTSLANTEQQNAKYYELTKRVEN